MYHIQTHVCFSVRACACLLQLRSQCTLEWLQQLLPRNCLPLPLFLLLLLLLSCYFLRRHLQVNAQCVCLSACSHANICVCSAVVCIYLEDLSCMLQINTQILAHIHLHIYCTLYEHTHTHYPHSLTRLMSMRVYAFSLSCRLSSKSSAYFRAYLSLTLPSSFVGVAPTPSSDHFKSSIWRPLKHALITCSSSLCRGPFQHRALSTFAPQLMACEMLIICLLLLATQLFHPPFVRISRSFCLFSLLWLAIFCTFKLQLFARLAGRFATNMALKRK